MIFPLSPPMFDLLILSITEKEDSCARLYCTFNLKQTGSTGTMASMEQFVLREDEDGHWKILGWELAE